ncbi:MAG: DUF1569 domain-containing protein [Burkholderiales bacterium]|jgi:hypothetical protein
MTRSADLPRRALLRGGVAAAAPLLASGAQAASNDRGLVFATLADALGALDGLRDPAPLPPPTAFGWAQTLVHCAQSIEYSMTGYPQAKSALFQRTAGSAAFAFFSWRGRMSHDLGEPIPGAPALGGLDAAQAEARLRRAVQDFEQWRGPLRPHFAYGELSREDYARAHAMHLANHFSAFAPRG